QPITASLIEESLHPLACPCRGARALAPGLPWWIPEPGARRSKVSERAAGMGRNAVLHGRSARGCLGGSAGGGLVQDRREVAVEFGERLTQRRLQPRFGPGP